MSEQHRKELLYALAVEFRRRSEDYFGWEDGDPSPFVGTCQSEAPRLADFLIGCGFPDATAVMGRYMNVEDGYLAMIDLDEGDDLSDWDNKWTHWWVRVGDLIVDTTADQFHPSDPGAHRVVVTGADDPAYDGNPPWNDILAAR